MEGKMRSMMKRFSITRYMLIIMAVVCMTAVFVPVAGAEKSAGKTVNILFLGNSFTFRHELPELVKQVISEGQKDLTVNVKRVTYGGQDMFRHYELYSSQSFIQMPTIKIEETQKRAKAIEALAALEEAPAFYHEYWKNAGLKEVPWANVKKYMKSAARVVNGLKWKVNRPSGRIKWDYLVLQSWQDIVPDVDQGYGLYCQKFAKVAEEQGTKVILYITSPHSQNSKPVDAPLALERTNMEMKLTAELAKKIKAFAVVPVPLAIAKIQEGGTKLKFRYKKDMHPNQYAAFLTANMFYAAMFKKSPEGFAFNSVTETKLKDGKDPDGGKATVVFEEDVKKLLQKTAYEAVMEFDKGKADG